MPGATAPVVSNLLYPYRRVPEVPSTSPVAPTPVRAKPRRHSKPHVSVNGEGPVQKLIVSLGRSAGLEPSDIIHAITAATGLDGEAVRNIRVLERFAFVEVPERDADRVIEQVTGTEVRGRSLRLERARG